MHEPATYSYDAASVINPGRRPHQEDALVADFADGARFGFIVLADGMGGHAAGDLASKIVVTRVFSELKMGADVPDALEQDIADVMNRAVVAANESVGRAAKVDRARAGMGSTVVAPIIFDNRLYWVSIGDSPLYLFRGSRLFRLNAEHSLARRMDKLVAAGQMAPEEAAQHPDRACLTSVLYGRTIAEIDCRTSPIRMQEGDILVAASDGLQFIGERAIARILYGARHKSSADIGADLLRAISDLNDPDQDNVAFCVLKLNPSKAMQTGARARSRTAAQAKSLSHVQRSARAATHPRVGGAS